MNVFIAEAIGTGFIILFGGGVVAGSVLKDSKSNNSGWIVIAIAWAIGVTLGVYAAGKISGAHLNPAVTIALAIIGEFEWSQVPVYIAGQFFGAMVAATLVWLAYLPHWEATSDKDLKLAVFSTAPAIRHTMSNFIAEFIATFVLLFGLLSIGANEFTEGLNPLIVGVLILGLGLSFGGPTGYAVNPARDLGPRLMHALLPIKGKGHSDWAYAWIPIVAPILGGSFGALTYSFVF